jgi:hypothetical protein
VLCAYATRNPKYIMALTPENWGGHLLKSAFGCIETNCSGFLLKLIDSVTEGRLRVVDYEPLALRVTGIGLYGRTSPQEV